LSLEVWIGTVSQDRLEVDSKQELIDTMIGFLEAMKVYQPDIICLPETFANYVRTGTFGESAESSPFPSLIRFQQYAKQNHCYLICPIIIAENGKAYNAGVVIDRQGEILGNYKKIHTTIGEMDQGVFPGPLDPPVFDLDFGRIGIQICFDIEWKDGWEVKDFPAIKEKYGRDIKLETFDEEEWTTIESLSPEIKVQDVMDEFGILTLKQHIARADRAQKKKRL